VDNVACLDELCRREMNEAQKAYLLKQIHLKKTIIITQLLELGWSNERILEKLRSA
jgi:hypothetical protein